MYKPTHRLIRSSDRDLFSNTQSTSNFNISFPSDVMNARKLCLVHAMIPYTFYNIMAGYNNTFIIDGHIITLPAGNYDLNELGAAIQTSVQALGANYTTFAVSYNPLTSKGNFSNANAFVADFTAQNISSVLGFNKQVYSSTTSLDAVYPLNISTLSILLHIDGVSSGMSSSAKTANNASFIIPVNVNKSEYIQFNDKTNFVSDSKVNVQLINSLNIRVTDLDGNQLQGLGEWQFILKFEHFETKESNVNVNFCGNN